MVREAPGGMVSARADGWIVGGAAIALWLLVTASRAVQAPALPAISGALAWAFLTLSAAHFGASYHLAYTEDEGGLRRHPLALGAVPAVVGATVLAAWFLPGAPRGSVDGLRVLVTLVFALTIWHYIKQAYGVARLALALARLPVSKGQNLVLRYSLYPIWLLSLVELCTKGRGGSMFDIPVGIGLLPGWVAPLARASCLVALVVFAATILAMGRHAGRRIPAAAWAPHLAGFLWIPFAPSYQSATVVLATLHAVQYLACVNRAERTWAVARSQPQPALWLLCVFGAAAVAGLFLTSWLAPVLAVMVGGERTTATFAAGLFAFLNLHHYAMDAVMWRSSGSHVRRMVRSTAATPPAPKATVDALG